MAGLVVAEEMRVLHSSGIRRRFGKGRVLPEVRCLPELRGELEIDREW